MKTLEHIIKEAVYERLKEEKTITATAKSLGICRNTVWKYLKLPYKQIIEENEDVSV